MYDRAAHQDHLHDFKPGLLTFFISWMLGVLAGSVCYFPVSGLYVSLMRSSIGSSVSIVGELTVIFLPLCVAALAALYSNTIVLHVIVLVKSFLYTLATFACFDAFGSSGWLVQILLLFCDNLSAVFLIFTLFRSSRRSFSGFYKSLSFCGLTGILVIVLEHIFILPLWQAI